MIVSYESWHHYIQDKDHREWVQKLVHSVKSMPITFITENMKLDLGTLKPKQCALIEAPNPYLLGWFQKKKSGLIKEDKPSCTSEQIEAMYEELGNVKKVGRELKKRRSTVV